MPPADSGKTLTPEQIKILAQWVEQGAQVREALGVCRARSGPRCRQSRIKAWVRNPIDAFVLARLEQRRA